MTRTTASSHVIALDCNHSQFSFVLAFCFSLRKEKDLTLKYMDVCVCGPDIPYLVVPTRENMIFKKIYECNVKLRRKKKASLVLCLVTYG